MSENPKSSCSKVTESELQVSDEQVLQIPETEPLSPSGVGSETKNATSAETKAEIVERVAEEQKATVTVSSDQEVSKSTLLHESVTTRETDAPKQVCQVLENVEDQKKYLIGVEKSRKNLAFLPDEIPTVEKPETSETTKNIVDVIKDAIAERLETFGSVRNIVVTVEGATVDEREDSATKSRQASIAIEIVVNVIEDMIVEAQEAATNVKTIAVDSTKDAVTEGPEASAAVKSFDAAEDGTAEEKVAAAKNVADPAEDSDTETDTETDTSATIKSVDAAKDGIAEEQVSATVKNVIASRTEDAVTRESEMLAAIKSFDFEGMRFKPHFCTGVRKLVPIEDLIAEECKASAAVKRQVIPDLVAERLKASAAVERVDYDDYVTAEERDHTAVQDLVDFLKDSAAERSKVSKSIKNVDTEYSRVKEHVVPEDVKNVFDIFELTIVGGHKVSATIKDAYAAEIGAAQGHEASASVKNVDTAAEKTGAASATVKDDASGEEGGGREYFLVDGKLAYYDTEAIFRENLAAKYSDYVVPTCFRPPSFDYLFKKKLRELNELALAVENLRKFLDYYKRVPQPVSPDESGYASRVTIATERALPLKPDTTELGEEVNKEWREIQQSLRYFLQETKDLLQRHRRESPNLRLEYVELYLERFYALRAQVRNLQTHSEECRPKFRYNHNMFSVINNITKLTKALDSLLLTVYFDLSKICVMERRLTRCSTRSLSDFLVFC